MKIDVLSASMRHLPAVFQNARQKWARSAKDPLATLATGSNGSGSTLEKTAKLLAAVEALISKWEVRSFIDVGCGSLTWMAPLAERYGDRYVGIDVVPSVIEDNRQRFPELHFAVLGDTLPIPEGSFDGKLDLIFCRDTLAHLSNATAKKMLTMMKETGASWLLSSHYATARNVDIKDGGFRPLNLVKIPFLFPAPWSSIQEGFEGKTMALWRFSDLPI